MSARIESWAWQQKVNSPIRKMLLAKLANAADEQGWSWWGQKRIARECELSLSTVVEHLNELRGLGLIQSVRHNREDGRGRATNYWRVMAPWVDEVVEPPSRPRTIKVRETNVGRADTVNSQVEQETSEDQNLGADAPPEYLGQRRWRVFSRPGRGPFTVDLEHGSCSCENRSRTPCRHLRVAARAEEGAATALRRERRDAVWDAVAEIFGPPTERGKAARGLVVTEIAEMLAFGQVPPERWAEEIDARYHALADDWGVGKVTLRAFQQNWSVAGKLLSGRTGKHNVDDGLDYLNY